MELILCEKRHFDEVFGMYRRVVAYLRAHVNYPEWSHDHPNAESVSSAIDRGELYACLDGGKVVEDGTYDELIEQGGYFAELVERQQLKNAS
jgi:ABC-type multidrug transport system fused ATPase/permease subunit